MLLKPTHTLSHLLSLLAKTGRSPGSTVLEISEREHIRDLERLMTVVEEYRREGLRFAVDDLGEGHTTFELMAASGAEFLKVGRTLTASATRSDAMAAIRAAVTYAKATHAQVIAEGIENDRARDEVRDLGIVFGQGFSLGEPTLVEDIEHVVPGLALRPRSRQGTPRQAG
jgi:EAL domain-containing protein (putative c-di-GMP-specific phosphodiesterase class I)